MESKQVELTEQWHHVCRRRCGPPHLAVDHIRRPQRPVGAELGSAAINESAVAKDDLVAVARRRACRWKFSGTMQAEYHAPRKHAWKHALLLQTACWAPETCLQCNPTVFDTAVLMCTAGDSLPWQHLAGLQRRHVSDSMSSVAGGQAAHTTTPLQRGYEVDRWSQAGPSPRAHSLAWQ